MLKKKAFLILLVVLLFSVKGFAMDFDDLFADDLIMEYEDSEGDYKPEELLLSQDKWEVGGRYDFSINAAKIFTRTTSKDILIPTLSSDIFLDIRPSTDFRIFGKMDMKLDIPVSSGEDTAKTNMTLRLRELFSDFNYADKVFFRAGKQNAKWGVGYFFSPADVINIGRIDPEKPELALEAPLTLKIHYPLGNKNYYTYLLLDNAKDLSGVALAPKMEFVLGKSEIGLGAFYQKGKAPRMMGTLSTSLGKLAVFAETVVSKGSDKRFLVDGNLLKKDDLFFQGTVGTTFTYNAPQDFFSSVGTLQLYYDGEGTGVGNIILKPQDHYRFAASFLLQNIMQSKYSANLHWLTNLSDKSGKLTASLILPKFSKISPTIGASLSYGKTASEYNLGGRKTATIFMNVSLGSGSF